MNEITMKITGTINDMQAVLQANHFHIAEYYTMKDVYYLPEKIDLAKQNAVDILNNCLLLRKIVTETPKKQIIEMTYKHKDIAANGDILSQEKINCEIVDERQGQALLQALKYRELMTIKEEAIIYQNDDLSIVIKQIENGDNLIEVELNAKYPTIAQLKQAVNQLNLPVDYDDYFVKKAQIALEQVLANVNRDDE